MARALITQDGVRHVQLRTVVLLGGAQVLAGVGAGATVSIGSILAVELSGSSAWAGAVATVMTLGAALAALPLATLADRRGRRIGLMAGFSAAFLGSVLMVLSVVSGAFVLLVLGAAGIGAGTAATLQARFAAVDLAEPERRGRALSAVVWAVTVGAVAGPNLIHPGTAVGQSLGLPALSGPFVIAASGLLAAIVLVFVGLRPDPLLLARELASVQEPGPQEPGPESDLLAPDPPAADPPAAAARRSGSLIPGLRAIRQSKAAMLAVASVVGAHAVMVGVMSMTPLHLQEIVAGPGGSGAGHSVPGDVLVIIGFTISLHIAGMFALSPVMGWLTDKAGRVETIMAGFLTLITAAAVAGFGQASTGAVAVGLVLLGLGWSAVSISGSTLLAESVSQESRVLAQGVSDMLMGTAGAVGGAAAGVVLGWAGYLGLNLLGGAVAATVLATALATVIARRRTDAA